MIGRYIPRQTGRDVEDGIPAHLRPLQIGVDVGKMSDPTALAVAELDHATSTGRPTFTIARLERLPLNTSYPDIAERLVALVRNIRTRDEEPARRHVFERDGYLGDNLATMQSRPIEMIVDATGVGRPLVDMISEPLKAAGVQVRSVTFRAGETLTRNGSEWSMGKGYMVSRLQVMLQSARLFIPSQVAEAAAIRSEIHNYEIHLGEQGKATFGARQGHHDDLVTALGLAALVDGYRTPRPMTEEDWDLFVNGEYSEFWTPDMGSVHDW